MKNHTEKITLLLTLVVILLSACNANPQATEQVPTATTESVVVETEAPTATPNPTPTATPLPLNGQETQYNIDLTIDYYNQYISGTSKALYTNKTDLLIHEMVFIVYPARFQAIYIKSIRVNETTITDYNWDALYIVIPLSAPLQPGEQVEVTFDFELYMPTREGIFSYNGKELNLSYFIPMIPYFNPNGGWVMNEAQVVNSTFIGEFIVLEPSDFSVNIQFADRRENFRIAAPALPQEADGIIHYQVDLARTLTFSISDQFTVTEREAQGVKILAYTLNEHAWVGEDVADVAVQSVDLFTELFGEYNRDVLSIVEFNATIGMEFDGLVFLSPAFYNLYPGSPRSNIYVYTAHEIAHQWFFAMVGNDQAMEPWLDEAFATYAQKLFYDRFYPDDAAWMWDNYVLAYNAQGDVDISIYFGGDDSEYRKIVYLKGARFLQALRETLGEETFFAFLHDYFRTYKYTIVTTREFWTFLQSYTDLDLTALHDEYFGTPLN
ncbi:MAG: M1 family metallopeptidase [Anaerolineaceae bacterium]|nr:M1 family metallopeptidase [Anaerolineaceae bacterium]